MKQDKRLTRDQKRYLSRRGYDTDEWRLVEEGKGYFIGRNVNTKEEKKFVR